MTGYYSLIFKPSVHKDLRRLSKTLVLRVMKRIEGLSAEPFPRQSRKLSQSKGLYRLQVGAYRIVYQIDPQQHQITIHYVRHRRAVYRKK